MKTNLTKAETNLAIAEHVFPKYRLELSRNGEGVNVYTSSNHTNDRNLYVCTVDYYNNWNCLMPLIIEHDIERRIWYASNRDSTRYTKASSSTWFSAIGHVTVYDVDPNIALAKCLLLVLEQNAKVQTTKEAIKASKEKKNEI